MARPTATRSSGTLYFRPRRRFRVSGAFPRPPATQYLFPVALVTPIGWHVQINHFIFLFSVHENKYRVGAFYSKRRSSHIRKLRLGKEKNTFSVSKNIPKLSHRTPCLWIESNIPPRGGGGGTLFETFFSWIPRIFWFF